MISGKVTPKELKFYLLIFAEATYLFQIFHASCVGGHVFFVGVRLPLEKLGTAGLHIISWDLWWRMLMEILVEVK